MDCNDNLRFNRVRIAQRIHDLLLHELGEDMDVSLMLGPPEYARAVLSLCRSCGSGELTRLVEQFLQASDQAAHLQRPVTPTDFGLPSEWAPHLPPLAESLGDGVAALPR